MYRIPKFIVNIIYIYIFFKIPVPFKIYSSLLGRMKEGTPNLTKFSGFLLHLLLKDKVVACDPIASLHSFINKAYHNCLIKISTPQLCSPLS